MEKGGEKGDVGGIAPWLLGDRRPWLERIIVIRRAWLKYASEDYITFCK